MQVPDKLHYSSKRCPVLIRRNLQELFPVAEAILNGSELSVITLRYQNDTEVEKGAKNVSHFQSLMPIILSYLSSDELYVFMLPLRHNNDKEAHICISFEFDFIQ